jgi:hypothetical protein
VLTKNKRFLIFPANSESVYGPNRFVAALSSHALDFAFRQNNHGLIQAKMTGLIFDLCFGLKRAVHYANPTPPRSATRVTLHIWRARILNLQNRHLCLL